MSAPLESIRNVGPAMAADCRSAGIRTAEELRSLGAEAAYGKLIESGVRPHFIAFYALAMGLQGRPWNDCQGAEKAALRKKFDALVAAARPLDGAFTRALDEVGVRLNAPTKTDSG